MSSESSIYISIEIPTKALTIDGISSYLRSCGFAGDVSFDNPQLSGITFLENLEGYYSDLRALADFLVKEKVPFNYIAGSEDVKGESENYIFRPDGKHKELVFFGDSPKVPVSEIKELFHRILDIPDHANSVHSIKNELAIFMDKKMPDMTPIDEAAKVWEKRTLKDHVIFNIR